MTEEGSRRQGRRGVLSLAPLRAGVAAAAVATGVAAAPQASANGFGATGFETFNGNGYYYADNSNHTWYPWALEPAALSAMRFAMGTRLEATVMTTDEFQSQDANTDVVVVDTTYANETWWGRWTCDSWSDLNFTKCQKGTMRLNLRYGVATNSLTTHETGHSVGLGHSGLSDSVMQTPNQGASHPTDFGPHDKVHINDYY